MPSDPKENFMLHGVVDDLLAHLSGESKSPPNLVSIHLLAEALDYPEDWVAWAIGHLQGLGILILPPGSFAEGLFSFTLDESKIDPAKFATKLPPSPE